MKRWTVAIAVVLVLVSVAGLAGCAAEDRTAAERARAVAEAANAEARAAEAQAKVVLAGGQADAERERARAEAAERLAATRQMERDAAHARLLATLPYVVTLVGAFLVAGVFVVVWADGRRRQVPAAPVDPAILTYLDRMRLDQAAAWRVIARLDRRVGELPREGHEVVIYPDR